MVKSGNLSVQKETIAKSAKKTSYNRELIIFLCLVAVVTVVSLYCKQQYGFNKIHYQKANTTSQMESAPRSLLLQGTTLTVPETNFTVTLKNQETVEYGDHENNPEAGFGSVTLGTLAEQFNGQIVSTIAVNSGGSGEMFYLALFEHEQGMWTMTSTMELADRIQVQSLSLNGDEISVRYLDHGPNQAMVDMPNVEVTKTFTIEKNQLELVE